MVVSVLHIHMYYVVVSVLDIHMYLCVLLKCPQQDDVGPPDPPPKEKGTMPATRGHDRCLDDWPVCQSEEGLQG